MNEELLEGQTNLGVVRIDNTVRRHMEQWSPANHELLKYLESVKFKYSPRFLGIDDKDREILTYFVGQSGKDGWAKVVNDNGLRNFAKLLRSYHDAISNFKPKNNNWALSKHSPKNNEIICHGDFGPWNIVWEGELPVGIVDWDFAGPARPLYDVAYALEYVAPFRNDEECIKWLAYPEPPNRRHRIEVFADAYGLPNIDGLVDEVIHAQEKNVEHIEKLASEGLEPHVQWVKDGILDELRARVEWTKNNRTLFE